MSNWDLLQQYKVTAIQHKANVTKLMNKEKYQIISVAAFDKIKYT